MDIFNDPRLAELLAEDRSEVVGTCPHCGHDVYPSQLYPGTDPAVQAAYESPDLAILDPYRFAIGDRVEVCNPRGPYDGVVGSVVHTDGAATGVMLDRHQYMIWCGPGELRYVRDSRPLPPEELT